MERSTNLKSMSILRSIQRKGVTKQRASQYHILLEMDSALYILFLFIYIFIYWFSLWPSYEKRTKICNHNDQQKHFVLLILPTGSFKTKRKDQICPMMDLMSARHMCIACLIYHFGRGCGHHRFRIRPLFVQPFLYVSHQEFTHTLLLIENLLFKKSKKSPPNS